MKTRPIVSKVAYIPLTGVWVGVNVAVDFLNWLVVYCFYRILKEMKELTKSATVWIPCPQPGNVSHCLHFTLR